MYVFVFICLFAYILFYIVVCLIGCSSLKDSKTPWKHVARAIEKLDNEEIRSHFIKELEALYQKHKFGSEEFCLELADLVVGSC
jgi:predicted membrane protein